MADRLTPEQRSSNMRQVHGKNTGPEVYLRKLLFAEGLRYRIHSTSVPGHPDIWLRKYNTAIFVHGCFWHRHDGCKYASMPENRKEFWEEKFRKNKERDATVKSSLAAAEIKCLIIWECTIKKMGKNALFESETRKMIMTFINNNSIYLEL